MTVMDTNTCERCAFLDDQAEALAAERTRREAAEAERDAVVAEVDSAPVLGFFRAVRLEAAHQRRRWSEAHDAEKTPADWLWTIGALVAKAVHQPEKRLHHIITSAAALANWHLRTTPDAMVCEACAGWYPHGGPRCEAVARGIRICPTCDTPCDPDGPCGVCACDCDVCNRETIAALRERAEKAEAEAKRLLEWDVDDEVRDLRARLVELCDACGGPRRPRAC